MDQEEAPRARLLPVALAQQFLEQYLPVRGVKSPLQFFDRQGNNMVVVKARVFGVSGDFESNLNTAVRRRARKSLLRAVRRLRGGGGDSV